jgi:hypothetical protein
MRAFPVLLTGSFAALGVTDRRSEALTFVLQGKTWIVQKKKRGLSHTQDS